MFKMKKVFAAGVAVLAISALSITAFAAYGSPAEAVADLTGQTVESVVEQRQENGVTYGSIAEDYGVQAEYQAAVLEIKQEALDARVAAGTLTQEEADEIMAAFEAHMTECDGSCESGDTGLGLNFGLGTGLGNGTANGLGEGNGIGDGTGNGTANGNSIGNGACDGTGDGTGDGTCDEDCTSDGTGSKFGSENGGQNGLRTQTQDDSCTVSD